MTGRSGDQVRTDVAGPCSPCFPVPCTKSAEPVGAAAYWLDIGNYTTSEARACLLDRSHVVRIDGSGDVDLLRLTPRDSPATWATLCADSGIEQHWIHAESAFAGGCSIALNDLAATREATLVIDVQCMATRTADAVLVVERKRGEVTTDYRTFPLHVSKGDEGVVPIYATVPVDELWRADEALKLYVWSHKGDSMAVGGLRVRVTFDELDRW